MEKNKAPIVLMHMSGAYQKQLFYRDREVFEMDCRRISGTNGYCDEAAKEQLRSMIFTYLRREEENGHRKETSGGIRFLDSGNYHYLSLLWMERIREPFSLVVFDNHPDMLLPAFGQITSCGGWVREALETNPYLEEVHLIGVKKELWEEVKDQLSMEEEAGKRMLERVCIGTERLFEEAADFSGKADFSEGAGPSGKTDSSGKLDRPLGEKKEQKEKNAEKKLYLSLDKDALSTEFSRCDWDQGEMTRKDLLETAGKLCERYPVIGVDICGERPDSIKEEDLLINDETNRRLLLAAEGWLRGNSPV